MTRSDYQCYDSDMKLTIVLPYSGDVSVNRYLAQGKGGRRYIRETALMWGNVLKGSINYCLPMGFKSEYLEKKKPFSLKIDVHFPRRFSTRSGDAPNFDKFIRDVVAATLGVDDAGSSGEQDGSYGNGDKANITIEITANVKSKFRRLCPDAGITLA